MVKFGLICFVFKAKLIGVLTIFDFKQLAIVLIYETFHFVLVLATAVLSNVKFNDSYQDFVLNLFKNIEKCCINLQQDKS